MPVPRVITGRFDDNDDADLVIVSRLFYAKIGKFPSSDQVRHWVEVGVYGGIRLRAAKICGAWRSTPAAVDQFIEARSKARLARRRARVTA